jgi:DNA-binding SARP family transcriptional activator
VPVPGTEWQSRKARALLKILVARRGHPVPREYLMEVLWPREDPARTANRLSVALSTVKSVLDPERRRPDRLVHASKSTIALDTAHIAVDLEHFLAGAAEGLRLAREHRDDDALEVLAAAETAYAGDFLEEDPYEDWAIPVREEARATYIAVAGALAELSARSENYEASILYCHRILERDDYDEGAHIGLVAALEEAGHHGEARRAYRRYVGRMQQIGAEPAPFPSVAASRHETRIAARPLSRI